MKRVIITSGFFNPLHIGHVNLMKEARALGDYLVVIVNNDQQVKIKGSAEFMPEKERMAIIKALYGVDEVFLSIDKGLPIHESLKAVAERYLPANRQVQAELYFAKGGDRNANNIPESEKKVCEKFNIKIINGVGGDKIQSSSWLLKKVKTN